MKRLLSLVLALALALSMPIALGEGDKDVLELTMWCYGDDTYVGNPTEDKVLEAITQKTGVKITDIVYSTTEIGELQRFYMLYAANELPDIILRDFGTQNSQIMEMMYEADLVYEISDEQLKTYCPDLMLLVDDVAWEMRKTENGLNPYILNMANYDNAYKRETYWDFTKARMPYGDFDNVAFISRDDILTALCEDAYTQNEMDAYVKEHGELPFDEVFSVDRFSTLESFFAYLYEVKEKYPDVVPLTMVAEKSLDEFFEVFLSSKVKPVYDESAMKVVSAPRDDKEGFENILTLLNKAYRDGVLDSAFGIEKVEQQNARWANGEYAVKYMQPSGRYQDINAGLVNAGKEYKYRYVPTAWMLTDRYQGVDNASFYSGFVINKQKVAEEDIPKILSYFNYFATDECLRLLHWGPEELGLWEEKDGVRAWKDQAFVDVINGVSNVGSMKDFDYYGIIGRRDPTFWKMSYWRYQVSGFDPYCYTVGSSETQYGPASALSLISTNKGYYDSLYASWEKPVTDLTTTFDTYYPSLIDQLTKTVITTSDEAFADALSAFYKQYYELGVDKLCDLYTEGYLRYIARYADTLTFHPEADVSVLDAYK